VVETGIVLDQGSYCAQIVLAEEITVSMDCGVPSQGLMFPVSIGYMIKGVDAPKV
jgi:hypothetical protein